MKFSRVSTRATFLIALCAACAIAFLVAHLTATRRVAAASIQVTPFQMERQVIDFADDPTGRLVHRSVIARRSDGTTAHVESAGGKNGLDRNQWGRRIEYADGRYAGVVDFLTAKATGFLKPGEVAARKNRLTNPPSDCIMSPLHRLEGYDAIASQRVARLVVNQEADGKRKTEWRAPQLGCELLAFRVEQISPNGSYALRSEGRLASLVVGEPDAALFDAGEGYREMLPSQIQAEALKLNQIPDLECPTCVKSANDADRHYLDRRTH